MSGIFYRRMVYNILQSSTECCFSSSSPPTDDKETARFVFTDASIKVTVQEVSQSQLE